MTRLPIRNASRKDYHTQSDTPTWQEVRDGALLRIADAVEKMALRNTELIDERDRYKRTYDTERGWRERAERQVSAMRGVITKMKKAAAQAKEE